MISFPLELVARVNSQMRRYTKLGNAAESSKVFQSGGLAINDDLKSVSVDGEAVRLTPIEYNILLLLVKNQGKVFSINQIYENIWNEEAIGADNPAAASSVSKTSAQNNRIPRKKNFADPPYSAYSD